MPEVRATLVHISDLHFGWRTLDVQLLIQLRQLIKEIGPQFLIVSGDVANNPRRRSMRRARRFIAKLADDCRIPEKRVVVIPGNHDYKIMGNVGLRRLTRVPFEMYFRRSCGSKITEADDIPLSSGTTAEMGWWKRLLIDAGLTLNAVWPWGKALRDSLDIRYSPEHGIAIFAFNSTPLFQMFGLATGKVGGDQISRAASYIVENYEQLESALKLAVVHHHPVPIAYVSTHLKDRIQESFMVFFNAGTFLRELGRPGVDVVLHGHKHFAGFTRVTYDLPESGRRQMNVLAAGSATTRVPGDPLGNEFNVIRVYDDDTVTAEQWYFSTSVRRKEESREYVLCSNDDVRVRKCDMLARKTGIRVREVCKTVKLTRDGYTAIEISWRSCEAGIKQGVKEFTIDLTAPGASYIRDFKVQTKAGSPEFVAFKEDTENSHFRWKRGKLVFGETRTFGDGPFEIGYSYNLMNGHALNADEFQRKYLGKDLEWEYAALWCEGAADSLKLRIEFPFETDTIDWGAEVMYQPWSTRQKNPSKLDWRDENQHDEESHRIKSCLSRAGNSALELSVPSPIPDLGYRIRWRYRSEGSGTIPRLQESRLKFVRAELIKAAGMAAKKSENPTYPSLNRHLDAFLLDVEKRYAVCDPREKLTISLAVFDDEKSVLRFVATNDGSISDLFDEAFVPGEGCAGFSFEKGKVLFYDRERDQIGYYIAPEEAARQSGKSTKLQAHRVLITVPWIDRQGIPDGLPGIPVGVLSIGSSSDFSRLLNVFDLSEEEQEREVKKQLLNLTASLGKVIIEIVTNPQIES